MKETMERFGKGAKVKFCYRNDEGQTIYAYGTVVKYADRFYYVKTADDLIMRVNCAKVFELDHNTPLKWGSKPGTSFLPTTDEITEEGTVTIESNPQNEKWVEPSKDETTKVIKELTLGELALIRKILMRILNTFNYILVGIVILQIILIIVISIFNRG